MRIRTRWPDVTLDVINHLRAQLPGVTVGRNKQENAARQIVLDVEPINLETDISRRFTVLLEAWVIRANGLGHPSESYRLMDDAIYALQGMPSAHAGYIDFDQPIGPRLVKDEGKVEYHEGSLVLIVSRLK